MTSFKKDDWFIFVLVLAACASITYVALTGEFGLRKPVYGLSLEQYSPQVRPDENVSFVLQLESRDAPAATYAADFYLDAALVKSSNFSVTTGRPLMVSESLPHSFQDGVHRMRVDVYDPAQEYNSYGSKMKPYYVFFEFRVV